MSMQMRQEEELKEAIIESHETEARKWSHLD